MRVYLLRRDQKEDGPMSIEDVRDRLDLRMITPDQPCRIAGLEGTYVAGELVTGRLFKGWEPEVESPEEGCEGESLPQKGDEELDGDNEDGAEEEPIEEDQEPEESWDEIPLWEGKPGYTAFLPRVGVTGLFAIACSASLFLSLPAWLSLVLAAFVCLSLALLLGSRSGTRYSIYKRRLQWSEPGFLRRVRELPRSHVDSIDIKRPFPGTLLGRADIHFHHQHPNLPNPIVFRQVARAREARVLWR